MQAVSPTSSISNHHHLNDHASSSSLTIDPAALFGNSSSSSSTTKSKLSNGTDPSSLSIKQEPVEESVSPGEDDHDGTPPLNVPSPRKAGQHSEDGSEDEEEEQDRKGKGKCKDAVKEKEEKLTLVQELLSKDHKTVLRPDLSPFADAQDAVRRLLPYHVWNIPHEDLLKGLDLTRDPVLEVIRARKRRRLTCAVKKKALQRPSPPAEGDTESLSASATVTKSSSDESEQDDKAGLNELGLPRELPEIRHPIFPTLEYAESLLQRRSSLMKRFNRTLTAIETGHKRAPSTNVSLEHLERLAYNDDREEVLAQIEDLKTMKAKLETIENEKGLAGTFSSQLDMSFGITEEIEREKEREREQERLKRQQERAAAKMAKLEKERETQRRLGILIPPSQQSPSTPGPTSGLPGAGGAATTPSTPLRAPLSMGPVAANLAGSWSTLNTPTSAIGTPGGYNFPLTSAPQPMAPPMALSAGGAGQTVTPTSGPPTPFGLPPTPSAPSGASTAQQNSPFPTSFSGLPLAATPSTPAAATGSLPSTPGAAGTPGPPAHRGRGRPRKHFPPGTPGAPPSTPGAAPAPRKKKEKTPKAASAMSPPQSMTGQAGASQVRPPFPRPPPNSASPSQPQMPGPTPGYKGELFSSAASASSSNLPPTPPRPAPMNVAGRPPTTHPTLTSATSLNTPRTTSSLQTTPSGSPAPSAPVSGKTSAPQPSTNAGAGSAPNPGIPHHPIPLLIPVTSLPSLTALGIQPSPLPHIRPIIGANGQPSGLTGPPVPVDPNQSAAAVLLGITEGENQGPNPKQQILHISVVLSKLTPAQLSGLAVLMQSLQAQIEASKKLNANSVQSNSATTQNNSSAPGSSGTG